MPRPSDARRSWTAAVAESREFGLPVDLPTDRLRRPLTTPHYHRIERGGNQTAVVFVHGLAGHYRLTWQDFPLLLVQNSTLNHCDIICWGYPTSLLPRPKLPFCGRRTPGLPTIAEALTSDLVNPEIGGGYSDLVLVGHSMGGLVIIQMIVSALTKYRPDTPLLERIRHVALYATPCDGVQLKGVLKIHRQARDIDCNGDLVNRLRGDWINRVYKVRPEDPPEPGKVHIPLTAVVGAEDNAVSAQSAQSYFDRVETVPGDHVSMCKPDRWDHTSVQVLKRVILEFTQPHMVVGLDAVIKANLRIVERAKEVLFTTGSRSRDEAYLRAIERKLEANPGLVHYRVLMGPPRRITLKQHVQRLLELRSPADRSQGYQTIYVGVFEDNARQSEIFLCGNERMCLAVIPPTTGVGDYSTAMVFTGGETVASYRRLTHELWLASTHLTDAASVEKLEVRDRRGP